MSDDEGMKWLVGLIGDLSPAKDFANLLAIELVGLVGNISLILECVVSWG
jgi:hypothetical protein